MTTVTLLRQNYLNGYLARTDGDTRPWTDAQCDLALGDALKALWPKNGNLVAGTLATDSTTQEYTVPAGVSRVSRIDVLTSSGLYAGKVTAWRPIPGNKVVITPVIADGYTLKFIGWTPFAVTGADLPATLEDVVAKLAAGVAYGMLAAELTNSQRQQNLDTGRIVDHQQAVALASYWTRMAELRLFEDPTRTSYAPRHAYRS